MLLNVIFVASAIKAGITIGHMFFSLSDDIAKDLFLDLPYDIFMCVALGSMVF